MMSLIKVDNKAGQMHRVKSHKFNVGDVKGFKIDLHRIVR